MSKGITNTEQQLSFQLEENFLLYNDVGRKLYQQVKSLPLVDPHNHIDPAALSANSKYDNVYQLWIKPDQYKNRAMRQLGIAENLITGSASDYDKYIAWARSLKHTVGNPLFHWSCMELKQIFGINEVLTEANAERVWNVTNELLQQDQLRPQSILRSFNLELLCTSDDLLDTLDDHINLLKQPITFACLPSFRGDNIVSFQQASFVQWLTRLQSLTSFEVVDLNSYKEAVCRRLDFFDEAGCLLSDHSLDSGFVYLYCDEVTAEKIFLKVLGAKGLEDREYAQLQSYMLSYLGIEYSKRKWKMQLHVGANRHTSSRLRAVAGPAGGYASIGNPADMQSISRLLDSMELQKELPKTILYNLNPSDNAALASLTGSFAEDGVRGKVQFGAAWWYNDHFDGIRNQLVTLSNYGLLSNSIGMTTDSRSILSFTRHDYFRRILCNLIGEWVEEKKIPADFAFLSELVSGISYNNIKSWIKK